MILPALLVTVVAVAIAASSFLVLWLDRFKGEPAVRLLLMVAWGVACALALRLVAPTVDATGTSGVATGEAALLGALVVLLGQLLLAAGLAVLATSHYLDGPVDGAAYGTVTGLGFAVFQVAASLAAGSPPTDAAAPVITVLGQAGATALVGGTFGFAKLALRAVLRLPVVCGAALVGGLYQRGLAGAVAWELHNRGPQATPFDVALGVVSALLLVGVFAAACAFEGHVLVRQLGEEVALGVLPEWVLAVIPRYRRRVRSDWWPRRDERREVVRLLTSLAYRKQQLGVLSELRANLYGLEVGRLRQRARFVVALGRSGEGASATSG